ncbi:MAG: hypothetical protein AMXMBFR7_44550 [Planctomycetota bacterium]
MKQPHWAQSDLEPDAEQAVARMAAWWEGEILDRPTLMVTATRARRKGVMIQFHASSLEEADKLIEMVAKWPKH